MERDKDFSDFISLRSGDMDLLYSKGEIRQIRVEGFLVLSSIYAAVRDRNWGTIGPAIINEKIGIQQKGFNVNLQVRFNAEDILFEARINIIAEKNTLSYTMDGIALSKFYKNRIGLCTLHPSKTCKGNFVKIIHCDGHSSEGTFPTRIQPDQPFKNIAGVSWDAGGSIDARLHYKGDVFEMEDQRNWTDASFKTYSTPLEYPFPVFIRKGTRVQQSVTFSFNKESSFIRRSISQQNTINIESHKRVPLPDMGISRSSEIESLPQHMITALSNLGYNHYRVDLWLAGSRWQHILDSAIEESLKLKWPLELVLHFSSNYGANLDLFLAHASRSHLNINHFLVFGENHLSGEKLLRHVVPRLKNEYPEVPVGGGTDAHFAELNRNHPMTGWLDFISYTICPQVHAFDDLTLIENIEGQAETVRSAAALFNKPVSIAAVSLKPRFNAASTEYTNQPDDPSIRPPSDIRQQTVFGAAWTLGSIKQLIMSGVRSVTFYETIGLRGLFQEDKSADQLELKQAKPLKMYPVYYLFKEILTSKNFMMVPALSTALTRFDTLFLTHDKQGKLFVANYTASDQTISVSGLEAKVSSCFELSESGWVNFSLPIPDLSSFTIKPHGLYVFNLELFQLN